MAKNGFSARFLLFAFVWTSRKCRHVLGRLDERPNILKFQYVYTFMSKRPEMLVRLDIRRNVLAFTSSSL